MSDLAVQEERTEIPLPAEARRAVRFPLASTVRVMMCDGGAGEWTVAQGLDLSDTGVAFLADETFPVGAFVCIELPNCRMTSVGCVRNCQWRGGWRIGMKLAAPFLRLS